MSGWKTWAAGIGAILGGAALVLKGIAGDSLDFESIKQGVAAIIAGLGVLGVGHKVDRLLPKS